MMSDRPGREIPKEYREIVAHQIRTLGWRYDVGGRHPKLWPADRAFNFIPVPTTPSDHRALRNFTSAVRRAGGQWPPEGRQR
jgi:hypothetical protein